MTGFIPDGYVSKGYIEGVPQLYGELRFRFRPVLMEESSEFFEQGARLKAREADRRTAKLLKDKMVEWDLKDLKGDLLDIDVPVLLRLNRRLFQRLAAIVLGTEPCDLDPQWSDEEQDEFVDRKAEAGFVGRTFGAVGEERDAKNS